MNTIEVIFIEVIFEETKYFDIDEDNIRTTIKAIIAGDYLIIDRRTKAGRWLTGGLEPRWIYREDWYLNDQLTVERNLSRTPAEQLRHVIAEADKWFDVVVDEVGKFMLE